MAIWVFLRSNESRGWTVFPKREIQECDFLIHNFTFLMELDSTSCSVLYLVFVINRHCNLPDIKHIWAYPQLILWNICVHMYITNHERNFYCKRYEQLWRLLFYYLFFQSYWSVYERKKSRSEMDDYFLDCLIKGRIFQLCQAQHDENPVCWAPNLMSAENQP